MSDSDGIQISDKASWEHSWLELVVVLGKRALSLPSNLKPAVCREIILESKIS